jgi:cation-transporting P-type ATPase D
MDNYLESKKKNHFVSQYKNLNNLLKKYLNINNSDIEKKKLQTSDWFSRPLTESQLNYAANDALHLIELRKIMYKILNDDKEFNKIKKEFDIDMRNKIENRKNKKDEDFKDIAGNFIDENMTVITENEYIKLAKDLFIELLKKTDEFASENNINTEKLLSLNAIFHICNRLPKTKEKILKVINKHQNINIKISELSKENFENISSDEKKSNNLRKKFYSEIIDFIIIKTKEIEKVLSEQNFESSKAKNIIEGKKLDFLRNLRKEASKKTVNSSLCKGPIYDSCKMLAPDGQQLCYCDYKKMTWYVERNLAEVISKDPPVFRLIFEPNARGCVDENLKSSNFYIESRVNNCVICGETKNYLRFHVVPILYRSCFPENLKSHKSHDVVLLCIECHEKARKVYEKKKEEISKRYGVPINIMSDEQNNYLKLTQFIKKCRILLKNKNESLPEKAQIKLKNNLKEMFDFLMKNSEYFKNFVDKNKIKCDKIEDINIEFLEIFCNKFSLNDKNFPEGKRNIHGKLVIEKVKDLKEFIMEWRKFFIDSFQPKFLPKEWSVEHEIVRTFGEYSNFRNEKNFMDNKSFIK